MGENSSSYKSMSEDPQFLPRGSISTNRESKKKVKNQRLNLDFLNIDNDDDNEDEEIDNDRFEVNMDTGRHKPLRYKRIYDAKYKIPRAGKLPSDLKITAVINRSRAALKFMCCYKYFSNTLTTLLMGASGLFLVALYIYQLIYLVDREYYITRARVKVLEL